MVLAARPSVVFDEINLSPLTKVIEFKKRPLESKEDDPNVSK